MICFLIAVVVAVHFTFDANRINNMNNEYGDCLDVAQSSNRYEFFCRIEIRNNPLCMNGIPDGYHGRDGYKPYFEDELECLGYMKQEGRCHSNNLALMERLGVKCT